MTFDQTHRRGQQARRVGHPSSRGLCPARAHQRRPRALGTVAPLTAAHLEAIASGCCRRCTRKSCRPSSKSTSPGRRRRRAACRASVFRQRGTIGVSMRLIPDEIPVARRARPAAVGHEALRTNRAASCSSRASRAAARARRSPRSST
jgi:Tfp pilus assembly pilus retraction ATPase PilT